MAKIKVHKVDLDQFWGDEGNEGNRGDRDSRSLDVTGTDEGRVDDIAETEVLVSSGGSGDARCRVYMTFERHMFLKKLAIHMSVASGRRVTVSDALFYALGPGIARYCPDLKDDYRALCLVSQRKPASRRNKKNR